MNQIISHTPIYVWFLLAYLIWGGWKSRKTYVISLKPLMILPAIMFFASLYSVLTRFGSLPAIYWWAISISLGIWAGSLTTRKLILRFDQKKRLIEVEGNWMPMILSISIFSLRYFLEAMYGIFPHLEEHTAFFTLENVATFVSGMFAGRVLGYWQRSKGSPHIDLSLNS